MQSERTSNRWQTPPALCEELQKELITMKTLTKLVVVAAFLTVALTVHAGSVNGYYRSNGTYVAPSYRSDYGSAGGDSSSYVYRNPYAADPSVSVRGYSRSDGTIVAPYRRTPPNNTVTDNLSYRGYGTIRVPRSSDGW